ncbi:PDR/VanB family oxidoreductase [Marinobacterium mangrovicola]|uniref:Phthalate 4,5-dioxygenase reductase subunit n=1 Tax=Marinobacterium mangrovicola TaxID=1476959 RepID=A0A4R1G4N9_9GAMM|nr:PDR/VanB family oxidoreductase [Marinobacterium mangrovicola]TCK02937.1 phthalate 4,5-dioxygenase reductase subunit [Marinobacterium mangrovicola]
MTSKLTKIKVKISGKNKIAQGIYSFELASEKGEELPAFEPGSHIIVRVPNGKERQYSLYGSIAEGGLYKIAVKYEPEGKGGSRSLIEDSAVGDTLLISEPRNDFPLVGDPEKYIFIAGGIGITPIYSMIQYLEMSGSTAWELHYLTRNPESTAFLNELGLGGFSGNITIHHTQGKSESRVDLSSLLENEKGSYLYCCGPAGLMDDVRDKSRHWLPASVHFEDFGVMGAPNSANNEPFKVAIADTDIEVLVGVGQTIIESLENSGVQIPYSCESGTCGTCVCELVDGVPDHRDQVLTDDQRDDYIMPCVSRAQSDRLTIRLLE